MIVSLATTRRMLPAALMISFAMPAALIAQSAGEHIALGDRDAAALNASGALRHYEEAIKADPRSYEALWKATREAVDLGEFNSDGADRDRLYSLAETYARRAVEANPSGVDGHFHLARAIGRKALSLGKRDQVKYAGARGAEDQPASSWRAPCDGQVELRGHAAERDDSLRGQEVPRWSGLRFSQLG